MILMETARTKRTFTSCARSSCHTGPGAYRHIIDLKLRDVPTDDVDADALAEAPDQ
jgi:hypothetical protein